MISAIKGVISTSFLKVCFVGDCFNYAAVDGDHFGTRRQTSYLWRKK